MSDPMTNREIEDVLTSIRRLVAQEGARPHDSGRLVLTESQRVVAGPGAEPATPGEGRAMPEPDFGKLEATIAELEAAVSVSDADTEAAAPQGAARSNVTELYRRPSFLHRAAGSEPAPDATPESVPAPLEAAAAPERAAAETLPEVTAEAPVAAEPRPTPEAAPEIPAPLEAAPGDDIAIGAPQEAGESAALAEDAGPDTLVLTEAPEPVAVATDAPPLPEAAAAAPLPQGRPLQEEDEALETVIDEAALRALVAHLVREELHGQLGEKITLQVRKLVRAEIARLLDERNLL